MKQKRYLIAHPESDSLFEKWMDEDEAYDFFFDMDGLAHDVTGLEGWEKKYMASKTEDKNELTQMEILISMKKGLSTEAAKDLKARFESPDQFMAHMNSLPETLIYFFDTETTGLPKNWKAPLTDFANWPRLVQFASQTYNSSGRLLRQYTAIVKPEGYEIPAAAADIHGITHERALAEGCHLRDVLQVFHEDVRKAGVLVGHNIDYDKNIMGSELLRHNFPRIYPPRRKICTMKESIRHCALPRMKWPKLTELHNRLFGRDFEGAHDAMVDVAATAKCFWELVRIGVIKI